MKSIKKWLSTLASMSYYSSGDQLDDHLHPSYLQFVTHGTTSTKETRSLAQDDSGNQHLIGESQKVDLERAKMNNSYP